ncbi:MAG: glycosyltransferase [Clostridia bacterium]|nr:glycosyltransferase [Clostridia bacterium]
MSKLVTIIIPVYNVEKYLKSCVESLTKQTHKDIEIILVDDGSPDNSGILCDTLAETDSRIVVIHKENGGVSSARNAALDIMKGDFVTFVDGDDYVDEDFISCMYNAITKNNADIATCGHYRVEFDGTLKSIYTLSDNAEDIICKTGIESLTDMFYGETCSASSGSKLYKRCFFDNLRFPDYVMGEDTYVVYHAFSEAEKIAHTNKPLYYYVQHESSVTNKKANYIKFYDYVRLYDHILEVDKNLTNKTYFNSLANRLIENNFWVYMKLRNEPDKYNDEKQHIMDNIKTFRKYVITNKKSEFRVKAACILSYFGPKMIKFIYDIQK